MDKPKPVENKTKTVDSKGFLAEFKKAAANVPIQWVLIVDDEPGVRRMVARSMTALDPALKVHEAENGQQALEVLQSVRKSTGVDPVLIVTDLQMPVMDGWDFINQLWAVCEKEGRASGIPIIVLSASSGEKGFFSTKSVHADKCLYSPLVAVAKEDCVKPLKYDSLGEKGLISWLKYFLH